MDLNLSHSVLTATFSNEIPNLITGSIQLAGASHPIEVGLHGNFLSDIAGCQISITNHVPKVDHAVLAKLHRQQTGTAGEMTASRRVKRMPRKHALPPTSPLAPASRDSLKNLLFFEWFNGQNQRVVIQTAHWDLQVSPPVWALPREEEVAHIRATRARRRQYLLTRGGR